MSVQLIDSNIIKETQESLGKIIKKPPMTEKLLSKPPFRFLHDIMTSIMKTTGFMDGLFTETEMNSDNVKEKDSKIAFLQKVVDIVSLVTGQTVSAKPSKIIAGNDPEKTNELLQLLAKAINKKVDNDEYVRKVLKGDTKNRESNVHKNDNEDSQNDEQKNREKRHKSKENGIEENEKPKKKHRDKEEKHRDRDENKDRENKENDKNRDEKRDKREHRKKEGAETNLNDTNNNADAGKHRKRDKDRGKDKENDRGKDREKRKERDKDKDNDKHRDKDRDKHREKEKHIDKSNNDTKENEMTIDKDDRSREKREKSRKVDESLLNGEVDGATKERRRRDRDKDEKRGRHNKEGSSNQDNHRKKADNLEHGAHDNNEDNQQFFPRETSANQSRVSRPGSARPGPPKPRSREPTNEEINVIPTGASRPNLIIDKRHESDNDDDNFITNDHESKWNRQDPDDGQNEQIDENGGDHGILVKKLLETKKELESNTNINKKTEIADGFIETSQKKDRDLMVKEIEKVRTLIQTSTRNINPLGKTLDFLQEDMDSMLKELNTWREECKKNQKLYQTEQSKAEVSLEPLKAQLKEVNAGILEQLDLIAAVKNNILENDKKMSHILSSVIKN